MEIIKECGVCGKAFVASKMSFKYCCRGCERVAFRRREAEKKKREKENAESLRNAERNNSLRDKAFLSPEDVSVLFNVKKQLPGTAPTPTCSANHTLLEFRIHNCSFLLFPLCTMLYQGTELLEYAADVCRTFGFFFLHPSFLHFALTDVGDEIGHFLVRETAYGGAAFIAQLLKHLLVTLIHHLAHRLVGLACRMLDGSLVLRGQGIPSVEVHRH